MIDPSALFRAVEESGLMTGAWSGLELSEVPEEVRQQFDDSLVAHVEKLIADALLREAMTKIQKDTGVDFGPMWKQPKHEDDNEQARKVV